MASCKGFFEFLLKLLNFLIALAGLAFVGYGIFLFVQYRRLSDDAGGYSYGHGEDPDFIELGRPLLMAVSLNGAYENLPRAWFIYGLIGVGVILLVISCFGCIVQFLCQYRFLSINNQNAFLVIMWILVQLAFAAFVYFNENWKQEIPRDKTGDFEMVYSFLKEHWQILRWVALGVVVVEALVFLLALVVRAANRPPEYDSDDEYIAQRQIRQPMLNKQPATGVPVETTTVDARPPRDDAWSTRMREKYGLDTAEFTYNPLETNRSQPPPAQPVEERCRCSIM
ncbi:hypothetical protein MLD38_038945 [Melastoma candidum]|uniref:Uncharacterized protein n=1 Tax=Melastoma candidum TaxID=119954 RepID=A0ACB9L2T9_9MYRT|nr:hypothetical protein MLD38_038945 [Melastoma candidum]